MTIKVGDRLPAATFKEVSEAGLDEVTTGELFGGKRVLLFGIPGAFTPVCSGNHVPGYLAKVDEFKSRGIDLIACIAVNDTFVMKAFSEKHDAAGRVTMIADDAAAFTRQIGMATDASSFGLGVRSERYAMIVEDGVVKALEVEADFEDHSVSSAEHMLRQMDAA